MNAIGCVAAFVTTQVEGKKIDTKRITTTTKKGPYVFNKQTLKANSRKIILRPVVYQNRFETFCFYSYITYKMVSCWFWNPVWPMKYQFGIILFFLRVSNAWKDVLLADLDVSPWILACWDCFLSVGKHSSVRNSAVKAVVTQSCKNIKNVLLHMSVTLVNV